MKVCIQGVQVTHVLRVRECPSRFYMEGHRKRRSNEDNEDIEDNESSLSSSLSLHRFIVVKPPRGNTPLSGYPKCAC